MGGKIRGEIRGGRDLTGGGGLGMLGVWGNRGDQGD